jgi:hypothetical protein
LTRQRSAMFEGQAAHLVWLGLLVSVVGVAVGTVDRSGSWLGIPTTAWLVLAIAIPILHQAYVTVVWRVELHAKEISKRLGMERGFKVYAAGFSLLMTLRVLSAFGVAIANAGTLPISPEVAYAISAVMAVPFLYLQYSVLRYFGYKRAVGIDHFDPAYRDVPLVREGIFRYIPNAMYTVGFLLMWIFAIAFRSQAALIVAAFSHAYIWVHYFFTERPDMQRIYE